MELLLGRFTWRYQSNATATGESKCRKLIYFSWLAALKLLLYVSGDTEWIPIAKHLFPASVSVKILYESKVLLPVPDGDSILRVYYFTELSDA